MWSYHLYFDSLTLNDLPRKKNQLFISWLIFLKLQEQEPQDHPFRTYIKYSEKLTNLIPWYAHDVISNFAYVIKRWSIIYLEKKSFGNQNLLWIWFFEKLIYLIPWYAHVRDVRFCLCNKKMIPHIPRKKILWKSESCGSDYAISDWFCWKGKFLFQAELTLICLTQSSVS